MSEKSDRQSPRIVVIGPCASGKTTLVAGLTSHCYDASVCAQEHSEIATLWRHSQPDYLIALDVDLVTIRHRRGEEWPDSIYQAQLSRLKAARDAADLVIDASKNDAERVLSVALEFLGKRSTVLSDEGEETIISS